MMISSRKFTARRTASVALLLTALSFVGLAFSPISAQQTANQQAGAGDSPQLAAFRQAVGGSITPLIVELKRDPAVVHRFREEQAGRQVGDEELLAHMRDLLVEQNEFLAQLQSRGVRALLREKSVTQLDGAARPIQYRFAYVLNGFVAHVATEDVERLKALPEVAHVSEPIQAQFNLDRAIDYSLGTQPNPADRRTAVYGANQEFQPAGSPGHPETPKTTKLDGFEGQNINVAIIDSGVDYRHPMFGGTGLNTPLPRVSGRAESADDNKKVIYFYTFNEPVGDPTDDFGHGTLVASCSSGYSVDGTTPRRTGYGTGVNNPNGTPGTGVGPTPNGVQLFGTAPQSRIMAYKVCGPAPQCAGDIELSIEDAASPVTLVGSSDGGASVPTMLRKPVADVINLSLGDTTGNPAGSTARAANNAALAGTILVASAGNSGPGAGTIGSPSAATLAISVAASLDPGSIAAADVLAPDQVPADLKVDNSPGPPPERGATSNANAPQPGERQGIRIFPVAGGGSLPTEENPGDPALNTGSLSAHYVFVQDPNATPPEVRNRIALVRGGTGTFFNIVNAVAVQQPAAIIITDDRESLTAVVVAGSIPVFNVNTETTKYLVNRISNADADANNDGFDDVPVGSISQFPLRLAESFTLDNFQPAMAGFSSRGPNDHPSAEFRTVKPDVTAPGVGVQGAATVDGLPDETVGLASTTGYTQANGTSFSGPITAGAMALLRQRVREELSLDTTDQADPNYQAKRFDTVTVARALLQNNATNLRSGRGQAQADGPGSASVNDMGSGHINIDAALRAKAIMVAPTPLFRNPPEFGTPPVVGAQPGPPMTVLIPTASFGAVPVVNLPGNLERRKEVIIRDVTNGQGGGTYTLSVQNNRATDNPGFQISFETIGGAPISSVTVPAGGQKSFFVRTIADGRRIGDNPTEFQWYVTATSSTGSTLRMPFYYRAVPADPNISPLEAQLQNISTRLPVQTGDNVGIGGFIITGTDLKRVILRGMGPSLAVNGQPVGGRLLDPTLELYAGNGELIATNDNWKDSQQAEIGDSGLAPGDDREAAIARTLGPGNYTAVLRGKNDTTGIGLVEAYDRDRSSGTRLANISTRGRVENDPNNVLIGGFIAGVQPNATSVVVRALGPSLTAKGVQGALQNPTLELIDANGDVIAVNNDYATSAQQTEIGSRGLAPQDPREAAIFALVAPGNYTAVVRSQDGLAGVGLVEVYDVQ